MKIVSKPPKRHSFFIFLLLALIVSSLLYNSDQILDPPKKVAFSEFRIDLNEGNIDSNAVNIKGNKLSYQVGDEMKFSYKESASSLSDMLPENEYALINVDVVPESSFWSSLAVSALPAIFILLVIMYMFRSAQSSNNQAMSFGKNRAKLHDKSKSRTDFSKVAGAEEAKEELQEIVEFLKKPSKFQKLGAVIPKGVLLVGPPGTGKTLLARAVAGEANVPFFSVSGSEFVEMFVGVGASRVRDMFKTAKKAAPCIVFIDEIDAVGRKRGAGLGGGHDEREQTLNQILTEMDGFETGTNVIVVAATNRPDVLDPALLRPGRFDRRVVVDKPDINDREAILKVHAKTKSMSKTVKLRDIARKTPGFTGADLQNVLNEAALFAARRNAKSVVQDDINHAVEKVALGPEKKSRVLSEKERKITSYHEVGHAVVGHLMPECDPVHKISIISRGHALGVTWYLPEVDRHLYSYTKFKSELCAMLGGYVAEKVFFGEVTTGPSSDLERATNMARSMVTEYGMSDLGPITFGEKNHEVFIGRDLGHTKNYSDQMAYEIDSRIKALLDEALKTTTELVKQNKKTMSKIAEDLLTKENISREEFLTFFK
ncbi:ATP-dependent metallopeptidase FtsH/Yme1/Tma family protein [bacterium]|jgi:cell division protease FtsH|nr:ATP-dependent metallopeptidase FtsH/Yme1/Tma family protein [bacterium]